MKKLVLASFFTALSLPAFSIDKGVQKDYYAVVRCPGSEATIIEGRCCEPGSTHYCGYVSCSNYTPPSVTCQPPSMAG